MTRGKDAKFYIAEQEDAGKPAYVCVRDANGNVLARMESRHVHGGGVDPKGDIYAGLTQNRSLDKFGDRVSAAAVAARKSVGADCWAAVTSSSTATAPALRRSDRG
jgi:hypothetical protein